MMFRSFAALLATALLLAGCSTPPAPEQQVVEEESAEHQHTDGEEIKTQSLWNFSPAKPEANKTTKLTLQIQDHHNKPIDEFEIVHEKDMHLIVVSKDLSYFDHIHPEYKGDGRFMIGTKLPQGGDYKWFADFVPKGGQPVTESKWLSVKGAASDQAIQVDQVLTKQEAGKEVKLAFDQPLKAKQDIMMTFTITDATSKQPITNLEPYLGATGHVVAISADAETYLHVHPMDETSRGPEAKFHIQFPSSGVYKIWGQFQHEGKNFVVPFVVEVP